MTLRHRAGRLEQLVASGADPYREMVEHFQAVVRGSAVTRRPCAASITTLAVLDQLRAAAGLGAPCALQAVAGLGPRRPRRA
jgi:hypothetical protein